MIVSELGSAFPYEGGPYVWTRLAYGRLAGAYTATFYWMSNPVWVGSTVAAVVVAAVNSLILPSHPLGTWGSIAVGLGVVWACTALSWIELKWGKWAGAIGTVVRLLTLAIFLVLVVVFLVTQGKPAGTITFGDLKPTVVGFLAVIGLLQFLFVGFELSSGAAEEMKDPQKDVPKMIVRSGLIASLVTGSMILGVLLVMPGDALSKVAGFTDAYAARGRRARRREHGVRLPGRRARHPDGDQHRHGLAAGHRARAGGRRPRRRCAALDGPLLQGGHAVRDEHPLHAHRLGVRRHRVPRRAGESGDVLRRHDRGDDLADRDDVPADLPVHHHAAPQVPRPGAAFPRARREGSACGSA